MRPLPLLGFVAGLAMLGWGGYSLYARFEGGPEVYWGREKVESFAEMEKTLGQMQSMYVAEQEQVIELRDKLAAMPAGDKKNEFEKRLDEMTTDMELHDKVIKDSEIQLGGARTLRDDAKGRALRRGILFTLLGLIWSARAGRAVFAPTKRRPTTAGPDPSPPSPRPDG